MYKTSVFDLQKFTDGPEPGDICYILVLEDTEGRWAGVLRLHDDQHPEPGDSVDLVAISAGKVSRQDLGNAFEESTDKNGRYPYRNGRKNFYFRRFNCAADRALECQCFRCDATRRLKEWEARYRDQGSGNNQDSHDQRMDSPDTEYGQSSRGKEEAERVGFGSNNGFVSVQETNERLSAKEAPAINHGSSRDLFPSRGVAISDAADHPLNGSPEEIYYYYNVLWVERKGEISYRRAAGRVRKEIWEDNRSGLVNVILG